MNFKIALIFLIFSPALIWAGEDLDKKILELLEKEFNDNIIIMDSTLTLSKAASKTIEQKSKIKIHYNNFHLIKIFQNDTLLAKGLRIEVPSKNGDLSIFTLTDKRGSVKNVKIVKADDTKGYNLNSKLWRKQFVNKNASDLLRVGKDIDAMSGATISSNAVTKAIKLSLFLLIFIDDPKIITTP